MHGETLKFVNDMICFIVWFWEMWGKQ